MQNLDKIRDQLIVEFTEARKSRGWTQAELSRRAKLSGLPFHPSTIGKIETGKRALDAAEAVGLASVLGLELGAVLGSATNAESQLKAETARFRSAESQLVEAAHRYLSSFEALASAVMELPENSSSEVIESARDLVADAEGVADRLERFGAEAWNYDLLHGHVFDGEDDASR